MVTRFVWLVAGGEAVRGCSVLAEAAAEANKDLANYLKEHFVSDPLHGAVAGAIDGNGNGG